MLLKNIRNNTTFSLLKHSFRFILIYNLTFIIFMFPSLLKASILWPLKEKTYLSGSFGECRKNHIHAGIDISTHGQTGLPIYAGESAYIYRVKTQYTGFGKALYLKCKNGYFLIYAHLSKFNSKIEKIVNSAQIKDQKFKVDIYPQKKIFIKKGQLIGYSGDTGGVFPHLHMELRNPKDEPINILKNGLDILDTTPPHICGLAVCNPKTTFAIAFYPATNKSAIVITQNTALAVCAYDKSRGNKLGIYQIDLIVDKKLFFRIKMDRFNYSQFSDNFFVYNKDLYVNKNKVYYNLFRSFNNTLPFYPLHTNGILRLNPGKHTVTIKIMDCSGNISILKKALIVKQGAESNKKIKRQNIFQSKDGKLSIRFENLYSPLRIKIKSAAAKKTNLQKLTPVSNVYRIWPKAAVFKKARISIKKFADANGIGLYKLDKGKWKYLRNNTCKILGEFCLFKDIYPPRIKIISPFKAEITDRGSGIDYDKLILRINGKKVIAEYSLRKKQLFYTGNIPKKRYKVEWIAVDLAGNREKKEMDYGR